MNNRVSSDQLDKLLDFLAKHPSMVQGIKPGARKEPIDKMWNDLAAKLNSDRSGSCKSADRWKKYWTDIKHKSKIRMSKRKRYVSCDGSGPNSDEDILELDKKIMKIIGGRTVSKDANHSFRMFDLTQPPTTISHDADIVICNDLKFVDTSASSSSKGQLPKTCIIKTETEADEDVGEFVTVVESPVSLPSEETSHLRPRNRATIDSNSQSQEVSPESLLELERSRVESERKLADAALIMAEATRTQAIALKTLVDLVQKQSEDTNTLLQLLQEQQTVTEGES